MEQQIAKSGKVNFSSHKHTQQHGKENYFPELK